MPHELTENNKGNGLKITSQHLARNCATCGHKQWVASGDTPMLRVKSGLHLKKTMICVWWNWKGMVLWEILENNATGNKELLSCPSASHKWGYSTKKTRPTRPIHTASRQRQTAYTTLKPHSKSSNGRSFSIHRILRTLHWPITMLSALKNWLFNFFDTRPFLRNKTN